MAILTLVILVIYLTSVQIVNGILDLKMFNIYNTCFNPQNTSDNNTLLNGIFILLPFMTVSLLSFLMDCRTWMMVKNHQLNLVDTVPMGASLVSTFLLFIHFLATIVISSTIPLEVIFRPWHILVFAFCLTSLSFLCKSFCFYLSWLCKLFNFRNCSYQSLWNP